MTDQRLDDAGPPFEPATPEEFLAQAEQAFQHWWDELDPPGSCEQTQLDYTNARCVWLAAYEQEFAIVLVYDSAALHGGGMRTVAELNLGYVVDRFHGGSVAIPTRTFIDWLADHEEDFCSYIDDAEQVHVCIKSRCDAPLPLEFPRHVPRLYPADPEEVRTAEAPRFLEWWNALVPPASYEGRSLDLDEARVVWVAARLRLSEALELVYESARAHSDVASTTADLELAYIVDRHHDGKLTYALEDLMDWSEQHDQEIHRTRNEDVIAIWIGKTE